jgi:hypothetical protein
MTLFVLMNGWLAGMSLANASEWSGTITIQQSMVGPANIAGADQAELDDYAKQIEERLQKATAGLAGAPKLVQKTLRGDIGSYQAERERVALARGGVVVISNASFVIDRMRIAAISDNLPRMVIDRANNQAWVMGADKPEPIALAPIPTPIEIDRSAVDVPMLGLATKRIEVKAEGRKFMVLVAPSLPNPFALSLLAEGAEESANVWVALASVPGLPMLIEYNNGEVTQRWVVTSIREKVVDQASFQP